MYVRKSIGFAAAVAMLAGTAAEAQSKIQWRHATGGALGEKVVEIAVGFNASQSEYVSERLMADSGVDFDPANYLSPVTGYYTDPDGNMLSMPFNSSTPVLYYNKDLFQKAGLDPNSPPRTWPEVEEASAGYAGVRRSVEGQFEFGVGMLPYWPDLVSEPQNSIIGGATLWVRHRHKGSPWLCRHTRARRSRAPR